MVHLIRILRFCASVWSLRIVHGKVAFPPRLDTTLVFSATTDSWGPFSEKQQPNREQSASMGRILRNEFRLIISDFICEKKGSKFDSIFTNEAVKRS